MRKVLRILQISIIFIVAFAVNSNAASINLLTDTDEINAGEEINITVKADRTIETTTFYLKYDNTKLEFKESQTEKTIVKDYPEEGVLRVVYLDTQLEGTTELRFKFKAKKNVSEIAEISITNFTVQLIDDSTVYTAANLEQSTFDTSIMINQKQILTTGMKIALIVVGALIVLLIIVNIIHKKEAK